MATYTPNLNLKKPSTNEYYDVVADLNDTKDKIDLAYGQSVKKSDLPYVTPEQFGAKGDGTADDVVAIELALAAGKRIEFLSDIYYVSRAIKFSGYKWLASKHPSVKITTNADDHIFLGELGADKPYFFAENFTLENTGVSTKAAIHCEARVVSPFTGIRYCKFTGITINGFYDGIFAYGFWTTIFERVRVNAPGRAGIVLGSQSNNIILREVVILNAVNAVIAKSSLGTGSIQLTSIHLEYCDLENISDFVFDLYGIEKFTVDKSHFENCPKIFKDDNVANLTLSDSRLMGVQSLMQHQKSSASIRFKGVPTFRDNIIYISSAIDIGLIQLSNDTKVDWRNNTIINDLAGKAYVYSNNIASLSLMDTKRTDNFETKASRFRYTADNFSHTFDLSKIRENYGKMVNAKLVCTSAGTALSSTIVSIKKDGLTLFSGTINAIAYSVGNEILLTRNIVSDFQKLIFETGTIIDISHSNTTGTDALQFKVVFSDVSLADYV